jgi:hypothetical protein
MIDFLFFINLVNVQKIQEEYDAVAVPTGKVTPEFFATDKTDYTNEKIFASLRLSGKTFSC